jgi:ABC-type dipeptide/oligopeptide/nickel transport system ATPase component
MSELSKEDMQEISVNIKNYIDENLSLHSDNMKNYSEEVKYDLRQTLKENAIEINKNRRVDMFVNSVLNGVIVGLSIAMALHFLK